MGPPWEYLMAGSSADQLATKSASRMVVLMVGLKVVQKDSLLVLWRVMQLVP